jgi:hypothetical protein
MKKEPITQEEVVEKQSEADDYYIETVVMMEAEIVYEDAYIKIFDGEDEVILYVIGKGISIRLGYGAWNDMKRLALGDTNGNEFDSGRDVLEYSLGDAGSKLYFRNNDISIRFSYREYELLKKSVLKAGSPHPWTT